VQLLTLRPRMDCSPLPFVTSSLLHHVSGPSLGRPPVSQRRGPATKALARGVEVGRRDDSLHHVSVPLYSAHI
jgi:hypothetical protein